jgi:hypothetical protein
VTAAELDAVNSPEVYAGATVGSAVVDRGGGAGKTRPIRSVTDLTPSHGVA